MEEPILFEIMAFVLGAAIGSFLNVCIYRLPLDLSINQPEKIVLSFLQTLDPVVSKHPFGQLADTSRALRKLRCKNRLSIFRRRIAHGASLS